jgi:hypothetical protein
MERDTMSNYNEYKLGNSNACSLVGRPQKGFQAWRRHTQPMTFERWFLIGVRRMEKKGAEFTFFCPGLVRIQWPGKPAVLRTVENFRDEYENEYLSKF